MKWFKRRKVTSFEEAKIELKASKAIISDFETQNRQLHNVLLLAVDAGEAVPLGDFYGEPLVVVRRDIWDKLNGQYEKN